MRYCANTAAVLSTCNRFEVYIVAEDSYQATRDAMLQQLNAERARRAQVTEAEGQKRAVELNADAELYAAEQTAKARRIAADAEAYAGILKHQVATGIFGPQRPLGHVVLDLPPLGVLVLEPSEVGETQDPPAGSVP